MDGDRIVEIFKQEALEHKRREDYKRDCEYYDFVNDSFKYRRRSLSNLRPKKGRW